MEGIALFHRPNVAAYVYGGAKPLPGSSHRYAAGGASPPPRSAPRPRRLCRLRRRRARSRSSRSRAPSPRSSRRPRARAGCGSPCRSRDRHGRRLRKLPWLEVARGSPAVASIPTSSSSRSRSSRPARSSPRCRVDPRRRHARPVRPRCPRAPADARPDPTGHLAPGRSVARHDHLRLFGPKYTEATTPPRRASSSSPRSHTCWLARAMPVPLVLVAITVAIYAHGLDHDARDVSPPGAEGAARLAAIESAPKGTVVTIKLYSVRSRRPSGSWATTCRSLHERQLLAIESFGLRDIDLGRCSAASSQTSASRSVSRPTVSRPRCSMRPRAHRRSGRDGPDRRTGSSTCSRRLGASSASSSRRASSSRTSPCRRAA